ncbi:MAG: hypothetical protein HY730_07005, partial [Candidatus Tectomicrobia bacterium]|nr:hypothetical protein [Candidatus Tectomicrobia bacterium]
MAQAQTSPSGLESRFVEEIQRRRNVWQPNPVVPNYPQAEPNRTDFEMRIYSLEGEIRILKKEFIIHVKINFLTNNK